MKINTLNLALASAITAAAAWIICSLLVWLMPGPMMNMTGSITHLEMSKLGWVLTPMGFVWGLIVWSLSAGIFAWLLASVYNFLNRSIKE